ncbi:MAG: M23 family metallopeptidase [Cyanobacteria bacterium SZAS TMP-1]|nr:M23 family metallopeptidase [Cyanobacteria bacterium SZAS TMP-1]
MSLLSALIGAALTNAHASAQCLDEAIKISTDSQDGCVRFFLTSHRTIEASVLLRCDLLQNLSPSHPLPYTFLVTRDYNNYEVLRLTQADKQIPTRFGYHFMFVMGSASSRSTVDHVYSLPYPPSRHCEIGQSYFGTKSHQAGTADQYAVDITMPVGTPVLAARAGTVIAYRDDSNSGGNSESFKECCNYIHIKHDDGTYAAYVHLKQGGVAVRLGQPVNAGTIIGYSGQTGWATCPHLHFMIYRVGNPPQVQTIPFRMATPKGIVKQLLQGEIY